MPSIKNMSRMAAIAQKRPFLLLRQSAAALGARQRAELAKRLVRISWCPAMQTKTRLYRNLFRDLRRRSGRLGHESRQKLADVPNRRAMRDVHMLRAF